MQSEKETGVVVTDLIRKGGIGFPRYEKYYILIEKMNEASTKISLKLLSYNRDMKGGGMSKIILKPQSKDYPNKRATKFLEKVKETLKEKVKSTNLQLQRLWSSNHPEENIIALTYSNIEQGSDTIKAKITLVNSTGTWAFVQQNFNPSASAKMPISSTANTLLLGPFYNKELGSIELPKGSFLQYDARSPVGIKGPLLDPANLSLLSAFTIDLMMRGIFNKELPSNAFDNSIVIPMEVGLSSIDPLFKTISSNCSGQLGALGYAIGTKNTEDALKAIAGFALCTKDIKGKMQEWLTKHYSSEIAEKYVDWASKNTVDILDAPTRATLIGLLTKYTFSAPPESWVRIEANEK